MARESKKKEQSKYHANIEGTEHPWHKETITLNELRSLGKLPKEHAIVEELPSGRERTLRDNDVVLLKPGHRFGRAPKFKRG